MKIKKAVIITLALLITLFAACSSAKQYSPNGVTFKIDELSKPEHLILTGKIDQKGINRIKKMFPDSRITINGKKVQERKDY